MAPRSGRRGVIAGLILAGGLSSRMGEDKALLRIDGMTLLDRTRHLLREIGVAVPAVSGSRPGGIPDRWPRSGPVGGIASAVGTLPDGDLLIVPVDMPRLDATVLRPLLDDRRRAVTCWEHHPLPMRMRLDDASRDTLDALMTRPGRDCSVMALQEQLGVTRLALHGIDTRLLVNCNTPHEWHEAKA